MEKAHIEKLINGDHLNNTELLELHKSLSNLSSLITGCGKPFKPFQLVCYQNLNTVTDYLNARDIAYKECKAERKIGVSSQLYSVIQNGFNFDKTSTENKKDIIVFLKNIKKSSIELGETFSILSIYCDFLINLIE